jgi:hypothetical protein
MFLCHDLSLAALCIQVLGCAVPYADASDFETILASPPVQFGRLQLLRRALPHAIGQFVSTGIDVLSLSTRLAHHSLWKGNCFLPLDMKQTPDKPISFHDEKVLALLNREQQQGDRSRAKAENAGRWLYRQQEDQCFQEIAKYLKS